jgi:enoyl-CoA hydratase
MITTESRGDVTIVRLDHGPVNAMDVEVLVELIKTLEALVDSTRAIVITGNGKVFSAGVDLRRVVEGGGDYVDRLIPVLSRAFVTVFAFPRPTVAAIDGAAIAGGCILAAACDHRVMTDRQVVIGATELSVGVPFPYAALEVMRYACGHHADDLVLRARSLDGAGAVAAGLVHEIAPAEGLVDRAVEVAAELATLAGRPFAMTKRQLRRPVIARIDQESDATDSSVAAVWSAAETMANLTAQFERLRSRPAGGVTSA